MSTLDRVREIVATQLGRDAAEFTADTNLIEAGFESLDVIETVFAVEEEFDIDINFNANESAAQDLITVGDIVKAVEEELAKKATK
ncbi:acyl carrier protein [Novosphingobium mangrovi (ex Huang et al. 2023)]|uniref:Acyl carrier protein n=1 Tax=Novosphingobium mangrovi (ex Huang et al. 2023) TaxID=2976432 RepID=A0ABT2I0T9_9SPHN|nr:phosphopantetheine-binding protein [Novosphingobium mangrovi (ex Huang et al. 2023)]MCT2398419.1 phosphopantetheine-binding protein [Novosphingobium mangrovi (ex Huang et al. 2023)]